MSPSRLSFIPVRAQFLSALLIAVAACGATQDAKTAASQTQEQLMQQGLDQLYKTNHPVEAQESFRQVIQINPTHYGAHYQLAVALDRGGKPSEARAAWNDMKARAEAIGDTATLHSVQRRLAAPDTASEESTMALGLYDLYTKSDFPDAATEFRRVIAKNPAHYGATYQLAKTLNLMGQRDQATPLWRKVLGMATQYRDANTIQQAKDRLK
jgi:Tfp pilus assembly protein PilF